MGLNNFKQIIRVVHILSRTLHDHIVKTWIFLCEKLTFNQGIMPFLCSVDKLKETRKWVEISIALFLWEEKMHHGRYTILSRILHH